MNKRTQVRLVCNIQIGLTNSANISLNYYNLAAADIWICVQWNSVSVFRFTLDFACACRAKKVQ